MYPRKTFNLQPSCLRLPQLQSPVTGGGFGAQLVTVLKAPESKIKSLSDWNVVGAHSALRWCLVGVPLHGGWRSNLPQSIRIPVPSRRAKFWGLDHFLPVSLLVTAARASDFNTGHWKDSLIVGLQIPPSPVHHCCSYLTPVHSGI